LYTAIVYLHGYGDNSENNGGGDDFFEVVYTIDWSGTGGVDEIKASFDLVALSADISLPLTQTFETVFREASGNKRSVKFSGNPGYIVGEPIRAGKLASNRSTLPYTVFDLP